MIVRIDKNNKVVACIYKPTENFKVDGLTTFEVESIPEREENTALHFDPETLEFYTQKIDNAIIEERKARAEAQQKKTAALKWLTDNDWKVNKRVLGEWTDRDSRWLEYLAGREKARRDIDQAEYIIKQ